MHQAYVGIVSPRGLEHFRPERPHTLRSLRRRALRADGPAICFWSVIADDAAEEVRDVLRRGRPREAFEVLRGTAREFGTACPGDEVPAEAATGGDDRD